jgi:4-hydroxy 2-oxovalerate aldolase
MADVKLLDCTLRDGGYINDWHWGLGSAASSNP